MSLFLKYEQLLKNIDQLCNKISVTYSEYINCKKGCCDCCVKDLTVFPIEFDHIKSKNIKVNHTESDSHCSLLKNEACQIQAHMRVEHGQHFRGKGWAAGNRIKQPRNRPPAVPRTGVLSQHGRGRGNC